MIPGLPGAHSIATVDGAADTVAITVPGIKASDPLLAVIKFAHGPTPGNAAGVDVTDYTVAAGTITGATVSTAGYKVVVIWGHRN